MKIIQLRGRFHEACAACALLKLDFLTNAMHLLYALSKAQGFVKPAPGPKLLAWFKSSEVQIRIQSPQSPRQSVT